MQKGRGSTGTEVAHYQPLPALNEAQIDRVRHEGNSRSNKLLYSILAIGAVGLVVQWLVMPANFIGQAWAVVMIVFLIGGLGAGIWDHYSPSAWISEKFRNKLPIEYTCARCHQSFNLLTPWECGWCQERNYRSIVAGNGLTPFHACANKRCAPPEEDHKGNYYQAALQCPKCGDHIILNESLYRQYQTHKADYHGAARFVGDNQKPIMSPDRASSPMSTDEFFDQHKL